MRVARKVVIPPEARSPINHAVTFGLVHFDRGQSLCIRDRTDTDLHDCPFLSGHERHISSLVFISGDVLDGRLTVKWFMADSAGVRWGGSGGAEGKGTFSFPYHIQGLIVRVGS